MKSATYGRRGRSLRFRFVIGLTAATIAGSVGLAGLMATPASASQATVNLGTAAPFAVLAGTTVVNTGATVLSGDLGLSPGSSVVGFPPGTIINGAEYVADPTAVQAQNDLTTAYNDAASRTPATTVSTDLGGQTLAPGVYNSASGIGLTGTVTLDGQNNPNSVFIFQAGSTLITASNSTVSLINGAQACNVFWQVGSSATLGTGTSFVGTILALTSATIDTGATVSGRVLARNGQVSLDTNTITVPTCSTTSSTTTSTTASSTTSTTSTALSPTAAVATTTTTTTGGSTPGSSGGVGGGSGGSGSPGVIPTGGPATGAGGASHSNYDALVVIGSLALIGSGVAVVEATRRRRSITNSSGSPSDG